LVETLLKYVDQQLKQGYTNQQVRDALLRTGYSPALINGVMESVERRNMQESQVPQYRGADMRSFTPKIFIILIVGIILIAGGIFAAFLLKPRSALLDIAITPSREIYHPSEAVSFDLQITNMGSKERFDVTLNYRILDQNDNMISGKEDTIAVSTTSSQHREFKLPASMAPGVYTMKVFANYDGKVATSSFSFKVEKQDPAQPTMGGCNDNLKNQDEAGIDCGGVCGGYWYDNGCHEHPKQSVQPIDENCDDGIKNQDEAGIDCGGVCGGYWYDLSCHDYQQSTATGVIISQKSTGARLLELRMLAKTDAGAAKDQCLAFSEESARDSCLKSVAQTGKESSYCELIISDNERDLCYYPFFMQGDYTVCEKLVLKESLQACAQLKQIAAISQNPDAIQSTVPMSNETE
jgi:hypothetical protein